MISQLDTATAPAQLNLIDPSTRVALPPLAVQQPVRPELPALSNLPANSELVPNTNVLGVKPLAEIPKSQVIVLDS